MVSGYLVGIASTGHLRTSGRVSFLFTISFQVSFAFVQQDFLTPLEDRLFDFWTSRTSAFRWMIVSEGFGYGRRVIVAKTFVEFVSAAICSQVSTTALKVFVIKGRIVSLVWMC